MVTLHTLLKINDKPAKRRGRGLGSGKGSKSGRGTTRHQTARTKLQLAFEGGQGRVVKKYPLLRGKFKNKSIQGKPFTVQLSKLLDVKDAEVITVDILRSQAIIPSDAALVKVVFDKAITVPLKVQLPLSAQAAKAVKDAGGTVTA